MLEDRSKLSAEVTLKFNFSTEYDLSNQKNKVFVSVRLGVGKKDDKNRFVTWIQLQWAWSSQVPAFSQGFTGGQRDNTQKATLNWNKK